MKRQPFETWLRERTSVTVDGCWNWELAINSDGYGLSYRDGVHEPKRAHRYVYEQMVGPIPDGLVLDHLCRNRRCVNPDHLEPVTHQANLRRGWDALNGRSYSVYQTAEGYWVTAFSAMREGVRRRKVFKGRNRALVEARMTAWLEDGRAAR